MTIQPKIFLFEIDIPHSQESLLNYAPGIWSWTMTPGTVVVTDDNGNTGYYNTTNSIRYNVKSARQDDLDLIPVYSIDDCFITDASFYYEVSTTKIYFHFKDFEPPLGKIITIGLPIGYSKDCFDIKPYFFDIYYPPRIDKIGDIKKSMDRLFFGVLKYTTGKVTLLNGDGHFDDFGSWNLYGQPCRILQGTKDTAYLDYTIVVSGFISDYSYDWESITIEIEDTRKGLTQPVSRNLITTTDYPHLSEDNKDKTKPVIFGTVYWIPAICLNAKETSPSSYQFLICDDEFIDGSYYISSVGNIIANRGGDNETDITSSCPIVKNIIYIDPATVIGDGTILDYVDDITIEYVTMSISNGVVILRGLLRCYEGKPYISTFWDTTETTLAATTAGDTGLYVDSSTKKLIDILKDVCSDIGARFFCKWDGRYTIRLYDNDRAPVKYIYDSRWIGDPSVENTGSEFLSSVVIKYGHDISEDKYLYRYEYTGTLKNLAHLTYKRYKNEEFETNLITETDAAAKALTIMQQSYNVGDIVKRSIIADDGITDYATELEITDFIYGLPKKRSTNTIYGDTGYIYSRETIEIYEIMSITKNIEKNELKLILRYVKNYEYPPLEEEY